MRKLRRSTKTKKPRPFCTWESPDGLQACHAKSVQTQECLTCEALVRAGKRTEIFTVHYCALHAIPVQRAMRSHVFLKHPINVPRALLAALRGEEI